MENRSAPKVSKDEERLVAQKERRQKVQRKMIVKKKEERLHTK